MKGHECRLTEGCVCCWVGSRICKRAARARTGSCDDSCATRSVKHQRQLSYDVAVTTLVDLWITAGHACAVGSSMSTGQVGCPRQN